MKVKSFYQFINEGHDHDTAVMDLNDLFDLGVIDERAYMDEVVRTRQFSSPDIKFISLIKKDPDEEYWESEWMQRWRGPGGLRILFVEGTSQWGSFDFKFTFSNGDVGVVSLTGALESDNELSSWNSLELQHGEEVYPIKNEKIRELNRKLKFTESYFDEILNELVQLGPVSNK